MKYTHVEHAFYALLRAWHENVVSCIGQFTDKTEIACSLLTYAVKKVIRKHKACDAGLGSLDYGYGTDEMRCRICNQELEQRWNAPEKKIQYYHTGEPCLDFMYKHPYWTETMDNGFPTPMSYGPIDEIDGVVDYEDMVNQRVSRKSRYFRKEKGDNTEPYDKTISREVYRSLKGKDREWYKANAHAVKEIYELYADDAGKSDKEERIPRYVDDEGNLTDMDFSEEDQVIVELNEATARTDAENRVINALAGGRNKYYNPDVPNILFDSTFRWVPGSMNHYKRWSERKQKFYEVHFAWKTPKGHGCLIYNHSRALDRVYAAKDEMNDGMFDRLKSLCEYVYGYFWHPKTITNRAHTTYWLANHPDKINAKKFIGVVAEIFDTDKPMSLDKAISKVKKAGPAGLASRMRKNQINRKKSDYEPHGRIVWNRGVFVEPDFISGVVPDAPEPFVPVKLRPKWHCCVLHRFDRIGAREGRRHMARLADCY